MEGYDSIGVDRPAEDARRKFLAKTYGWMGIALLISAGAAYITASSPALLRFIFIPTWHYMVLAIGEIALVWWLSASIRKISLTTAIIGFIAYSVINGMTLSSILYLYSQSSIAVVFLSCAAMFAGMAIYGLKTKSDLRGYGRYLIMALWGIIVASLLNFLFKSSGLSFVISLVSVAVFAGLTAYDSQKILSISTHADDSEAFGKIAIIGALELYLDFINMFLALLRLFGRGRN